MPIIHNRKQIRKDRKIIFMGKIFFQPKKNELLSQEELISCENDLLNDFSLIDNLDFWKRFKKQNNQTNKFENYRILKTFLREKVILKINKNFKDSFLVYGENINNSHIKFKKPVFDLNKVKKFMRGIFALILAQLWAVFHFTPGLFKYLKVGDYCYKQNRLIQNIFGIIYLKK